MKAVFLGGIADGREMEVIPKERLYFPIPDEPVIGYWRDPGPPPLSFRWHVHVYCLVSNTRLSVIRQQPPTPSLIKVQLSDAECLYVFEGEES